MLVLLRLPKVKDLSGSRNRFACLHSKPSEKLAVETLPV